MLGRATITLSVGPHSIFLLIFVILLYLFQCFILNAFNGVFSGCLEAYPVSDSYSLLYHLLVKKDYLSYVIIKILYALPVYFGYLTEGHKDMLRRVLKRANRMGFTYYGYDLDHLNETSQ